jgi:hypothetical protein
LPADYFLNYPPTMGPKLAGHEVFNWEGIALSILRIPIDVLQKKSIGAIGVAGFGGGADSRAGGDHRETGTAT